MLVGCLTTDWVWEKPSVGYHVGIYAIRNINHDLWHSQNTHYVTESILSIFTYFIHTVLTTSFCSFGNWGPELSETLSKTPGHKIVNLRLRCKQKSELEVVLVFVCAKSLLLCPIICDPVDCSPPGSSVRRILQARILEWCALPSSGDLPNPGSWIRASYGSCIGR